MKEGNDALSVTRKKNEKIIRIWEHSLENNFDKTIDKVVDFLKE